MNWRRLTEKDPEYVELIKQSSIYVVRLVAVSARGIDEDGFFDQKPGQINHLTGPNGNRRESAQLLAMGGWLAFSEEERARNPAKSTEGNGGRAALKARPLMADPIQFPTDKPGLNYGPEPRLAGEEVPFWRAAVDPCKEDVYWMAYQLACGVQYSGFRRGAGFRGIWEFHKTDGDRNLLDQCPFNSPSKMVTRLQAPPRCSRDN
ncbi:hypothetical protein QBC46DRAFT_284865 [Diplogelasinospora grovesii]|uniref:Uncharacterized protein n=1 Tax=Diplogelasinospora grovesii TaxID=303347 RepID=A0AAN6S6Q3_9PEZI|nr:hypothetical protein QBC46DRAFT_284865 [Diplogelasinospora grovesii]